MTCPTKLLYHAAMKTPAVQAPRKTVTYTPAAEGHLSGECQLCGCRTEKGFKKEKVIKPTFQDRDLFKAQWSQIMCEHCAWAISYHETCPISDGTT